MWGALALVLSVGLVVWRTEAVVRAFLPSWLSLQEQRQAAEQALKSAGPQRDPLPPDLEAIALQETEGWAREQVRAAFMDDYEATQDWDRVRTQHFGGRA
jgi:hypothetical protein